MEFDENKIKMKIAISKLKEEDIVMENKTRSIIKAIITTIVTLLIGTGVVYAGTIVYEKIWKTPEKIQFSTEITEEIKKENITEEEAKQIAINKFNQVGFSSNIIDTHHYKHTLTEAIMYRFENEDNYLITIDGKTGEFTAIHSRAKGRQDINLYITKEQAIETANKYYKLFGFKEGEYEIVNVNSDIGKYGGQHDNEGVKFTIEYNKKYCDIFNPYESIDIVIESKNLYLDIIAIRNKPFDNNEVVISKEEALEIALAEDEGINDYGIKNTQVKLMVVKMNADAYERKHNTEHYYEELSTYVAPEDRSYYKPEDRIRLAWVVVISYNNTGWDVKKTYTDGKYSYFVDATTGEVIGGLFYDFIESGI